MKGDEDLGQDITMKGKPFHYGQFAGGDEADSWKTNMTVKGDKIMYAQAPSRPQQLAEGVCDGSNGSSMQDCRVTRFGDQNPRCSGAPGQEPGRNCVNTLAQAEGVCEGTNG